MKVTQVWADVWEKNSNNNNNDDDSRNINEYVLFITSPVR